LKSNFDVREGDGDSEISEKVKRQLNIYGVDKVSTLPYLLELLSVKDSGIDKIPTSPEARKDRIMQAVKQITLRGSDIRPLVIAIEDLHWIDKSSEDYLKELLGSISGASIFLIFTYRPEFVHTWGGKSYHSQVTLNRLSNRESLAMVAYLLDTEEIDSSLEELVLEKTEGVPFFIEEFLKSLMDLKVIERRDNRCHLTKDIQDLAIPSTIQDVIMARVDSLPEEAKEVLQTGSVIEREFGYELTKRVTGLSEKELLKTLSVLKDSELLFERGIFPESAYIFKHALTREVVYNSMLTRRKKSLHEEIGKAIEGLYKENIDEHYGVLAEHYVLSENYEKGAEYSRLAARKAEKTASLNHSITYTKKRVTCLERLPRTDDLQKKIIDARAILGLYYLQFNEHAEAKKAVEPIVELALERDYKKRLSQIYIIIGTYSLFIEEDCPEAIKHLEEALRISEEANDIVSMYFAYYWLAVILGYNCEFERAVYYLGKTIDINVAGNNLWGISLMKSNLGFHYYHIGNIDLAYETSHEALRIAEDCRDLYSKAMAYTSLGVSCYGKGFLKEAEESSLKAVDFSERVNLNLWIGISHFILSRTYLDLGKYEKSIDHCRKSIRIYEYIRVLPSYNILPKITLAMAKAMNNEKDIDLESMYLYANDNKLKLVEGWTAGYLGEILLNIDDQHISEAEDWIKKAIEAAKKNGMMWQLGMDYGLYAELYKRKRDQSKASENLTKAIEILKECGADGWVEKYEKELATIS